ncbi:MAG: aminotransferase class V-fold PLP-dependent enzyme [Candidatus Xenobia bacterium]
MPGIIYLDNATTSHPKPDAVYESVNLFMRRTGVVFSAAPHSPAVAARKVLAEARELLASMIGAPDPGRLMPTTGRAEAVRLAMRSCLRPGDRVVTTMLEHRSLLNSLAKMPGVQVDTVEASAEGHMTVASMLNAIDDRTRLVCCPTAAAIPGTLLPVADIVRTAHQAGALVLVDATDTVGQLPLDVWSLGADFVAFSMHRWLLGPPGVGVLYVAESAPLPQDPGDTLNTWAWAGCLSALQYLTARPSGEVRMQLTALTERLRTGLAEAGVTVYGSHHPDDRIASVCFNLPNQRPMDVARSLAKEHKIAVGVGFHDTPLIHRALGTMRDGTLRAGIGLFNTDEHIDALLAALQKEG